MTASTSSGAARYVGARVHRVEDARLLTGRGTYVDDVVAARECCTRASSAARSPGRRSGGSTPRPRSRMPGVRFVFTAADLNPDVKEQWHTSIGAASPETPRPPLAEGEVRFVGDPVALVVAESRVPRRGRGRAGRGRLRARCPPSSTTPTAEHADALVHESHGSNVIGEIAGLPAVRARGRVRLGRARRERDDLPAGVRAGADGRARPGRRLLARDRRPDDLRGDAVAARGAAVLLPPARDARAPHPRRDARHRRRVRPEGHGPARRDVPDARRTEGRRAAEVGGGPPREPARGRQVAPRARRGEDGVRRRRRDPGRAHRLRLRLRRVSHTLAGRSRGRRRDAVPRSVPRAARRVRDQDRSTRTPSGAPRTAVRGSSSRWPARCCSTSRRARWASTRSSSAGATCCATTSFRTRIPTA